MSTISSTDEYNNTLLYLQTQKARLQAMHAFWEGVRKQTVDIFAFIEGNSIYYTALAPILTEIVSVLLSTGLKGLKTIAYRRAKVDPSKRTLKMGIASYDRLKQLNAAVAKTKGLPRVRALAGKVGGRVKHYNVSARAAGNATAKEGVQKSISSTAKLGYEQHGRHVNLSQVDGIVEEWQIATDQVYECISMVADDPTSYRRWFEAWCLLVHFIDPTYWASRLAERQAESHIHLLFISF
jgi:hypothetical protein